MTEVARCSCWHLNSIPKGLSAPAPLYICIKSWNKLNKIRLKGIFFKLVANEMTKVTRGFCWHQNFVPWGCLPLTCGYIHLLNHEKMCIMLKRFFLNLQQMSIVMRLSCWHKNLGPNGLSALVQGLHLNFFSSVTADFNISSALRWAIQDQWSSGFCILQCQSGPWSYLCWHQGFH